MEPMIQITKAPVQAGKETSQAQPAVKGKPARESKDVFVPRASAQYGRTPAPSGPSCGPLDRKA